MQFEVGDRVEVRSKDPRFNGLRGTVAEDCPEKGGVLVMHVRRTFWEWPLGRPKPVMSIGGWGYSELQLVKRKK